MSTSVSGLLTSGTNISSSAAATVTNKNSLSNMDSFLTLFCTQLQYQDPNNPMESYELSSQLAQFSSVEQLSAINSNMAALQDYVASLNNSQLLDLVGKKIVAENGALPVSGGETSSVSYTLPTAGDGASKQYAVTVQIADSSGKAVRTIDVGTQSSGDFSYKWDGKNDSGGTVEDGSYTCTISATDSNGNVNSISGRIEGTVGSIALKNGVAYLVLEGASGVQIPVSEVTQVKSAGMAS